MVLRQIRKVTDKPLLAVLNTHVHGDHWLGNQAMLAVAPQVPIYAHPEMLKLVAQGAGEEWVQRMMSATEGATEGTVAEGPTRAARGWRDPFDRRAHLQDPLLPACAQHLGPDVRDPGARGSVPGRQRLQRRIVRMDDGSFIGSIAALDGVKGGGDGERPDPGARPHRRLGDRG
jgi:hypothetical protein